MTAQPDNAALIARASDPDLLHWFEGSLVGGRDEHQDDCSGCLIVALAAALAAAERDYLELGDELATELADERHLHNETLSKLAAAEERSQAAEAANSNLADSREAWHALAEKIAVERDAAEAQVRELRETLERNENDWAFIFNLAPGLPAEIETVLHVLAEANLRTVRAVLARSAGRAET